MLQNSSLVAIYKVCCLHRVFSFLYIHYHRFLLALKGSYLVCSELGGFCASDGRSQPVVVVVVAWLPMASYGVVAWLPMVAALASSGRRRLGFLWSPPWLPMACLPWLPMACLHCLLALLACFACLHCLLAVFPCIACLQCFLALLACIACLLCLLALLACFACFLCCFGSTRRLHCIRLPCLRLRRRGRVP